MRKPAGVLEFDATAYRAERQRGMWSLLQRVHDDAIHAANERLSHDERGIAELERIYNLPSGEVECPT